MVAVVGVVSLLALAGCTDAPEEPLPIPTSSKTAEPTPTPEYTPGLDPEADVAAAIKTYEAYVAAGNNVVVADEATWAPVLSLTTGGLRDATEASFEDMRANGRDLKGAAQIASADLAGRESGIIVLDTCLDVSNTDVVASGGVSVLDPDRSPVSSLRVRFVLGEDAASWLLDHVAFRDDGPACL